MRRFAWVCLALVAASACDEAPSDPTDAGADAEVMDPSVIYVRYEPEGAGFYRTPWPSDARLTAEGTPDMTGFGRSRTLRQATAEIEARVRGFATMPVVYFALDAPVTEAAIPQNLDALSPESAIQLIDLSEEGCGARLPLEISFAAEGDELRDANMLQVANAIGTVLTPGRPYGAVILRSFGAPDGRSTRRPDAFDRALRDASGGDALSASLEPLRRCLPSAGLSLDDVAVATVFTPQDPVREMQTLRDFVMDESALETRPLGAWRRSESYSRRRLSLVTHVGTVQMPIFQEGETPYMMEGGGLVFDDAGRPVVQRWEEVDIAVAHAVLDPEPSGPRPVLIFMDGTGWTPWGHIGDNWIQDALAAGFVVASFMPQFHGGRAGFMGDTSVTTFNLPNPAAVRSNFRQEAAEISYFIRLIRERIAGQAGLPELDGEAMVYGGHSQGALCGSIVAAVEDQLRAYVFNGLSSYLTFTILYRMDLADFQAVVRLLYQYNGTLDRWSPLLQVMQLGAEVVDPHNYVRRWHGWPAHPGGNHVFVVNGYTDVTTTPRGMEHLTMAADMPPIAPPGWEVDPVGVWDGVPVPLPIMGNETASSGAPLTLATYLHATHGHGTIYRVPLTRELATTFWSTSLSGVPVLASRSEHQCGDGGDDDRDGDVDCDDADCVSTPPCVEGPCDNGVDDDDNGLTDCADSVCAGSAACREMECGNGADDDGDGLADCADADCAARAPCAEGVCDDMMDGDGDGAVDCADSDCAGASACRERSCNNRADDDGDGMIDCADPDCRTSLLCPERACTGGTDEDGDGLADCADPSCAFDDACMRPRETACANGTDDDGDGASDCADADCALAAACAAATCADGDLGSQTGIALFTGDLDGRANGYPPGDCLALGTGGDAPDIALAWTAPAAGEYVLSTRGSAIDTALSVIAPDCDPVRELACNDDQSPLRTSEVRITLEEGESVVIVLGAFDPTRAAGRVVLHVYPVP